MGRKRINFAEKVGSRFQLNDVYRYIAIGKQRRIKHIVEYRCTKDSIRVEFVDFEIIYFNTPDEQARKTACSMIFKNCKEIDERGLF